QSHYRVSREAAGGGHQAARTICAKFVRTAGSYGLPTYPNCEHFGSVQRQGPGRHPKPSSLVRVSPDQQGRGGSVRSTSDRDGGASALSPSASRPPTRAEK